MSVGTFTAKDPILFDGGADLYGYCLFDPVNAVDPIGLECEYSNMAMSYAGMFVIGGLIADDAIGIGVVDDWLIPVVATTMGVDIGSRIALEARKEKYKKPDNLNQRKGAEDRKKTGDRERNVGHPDGEEHSRVPKGPRIPGRR